MTRPEYDALNGYYDARLTLMRSSDYAERETAAEWLRSYHGKEAARLAFKHETRIARAKTCRGDRVQ